MSDTERAPAGFSREEAADRAGVPVDVVGRFVDLGLLTPAEGDRFSTGDVRRIMVGQTLSNAGIPLESFAGVLARGEASLAFLDSPVLIQEGDYFGQTVNIAARIADYARPGEILVSQAVVDVAGDANAAFSEIGPIELKGISEAIRLHIARRG